MSVRENIYKYLRIFIGLGIAMSFLNILKAQTFPETHYEKFSQLGSELPTANNFRTAAGAPGASYWQQKADYDIKIRLDDDKKQCVGHETITYYNNSPDPLAYLWLQIDQNIFQKESDAATTQTKSLESSMSVQSLSKWLKKNNFDGGFKIHFVRDKSGKGLPYTVNKTMMRVDLPTPLKSKETFVLSISWEFNINEHSIMGGRGGYEYFEKDKNTIYEMAQWFPRMAVYNDYGGWQHKQFLGAGEFSLTFGDYKVDITVPSDFVVGATGVLKNPKQVLTTTQIERLKKAENEAKKPVLIITPDEAKQNETSRATGTKTWSYQASNVRDFAWAASRKFIWDAMSAKVGNNNVLCMSYYPKEGNPLWEQYSTQAVAHTVKVYSKYTIDYPYPVAISVNGPVYGMEYPMICFNGPRPEEDGTYSERTKNGLISVIIHEVGHNFFPMIINSDERQWTWMDEGLNSFTQFLCEQEWSRTYPSRRGPAKNIVDYMKGDKRGLEPIMTNSESVIQFGNNAYGKAASALNILRETVMGRELFDFAFKQYAQRWAFKHPEPADFFRTIEDASGVDLDWFWRGWFYGIDPVDISIKNVESYVFDSQNPDIESPKKIAERDAAPKSITEIRNRESIAQTLDEENPSLKDFYDSYDPLKPTILDKRNYERYYSSLTEEEKKILTSGFRLYQIDFENVGGLISPIIVEFTFTDGQKEIERIPAEIWRKNAKVVSKVFLFEKDVKSIALDPNLETADIEIDNNHFPPKLSPSRFQLFKEKEEKDRINPMRIQRRIDSINHRKNEN